MKNILIPILILCINIVVYGQSNIENATRINEYINDNLAQKSTPKVITNHNDVTAIIWEDIRNGYDELFFQLVDDNNQLVGSNINLHPGFNIEEGEFDIAALSNGNFVITWSGAESGIEQVYYTILDEQGNEVLPIQLLMKEEGASGNNFPVVEDFKDDEFILAFAPRNLFNPTIQIQTFNYNGDSTSSRIILDTLPSFDDFLNIDIAVNGNDEIFICFQREVDFRDYNIGVAILDENLQLVGLNRQVNEFEEVAINPTCVVMNNDDFALFWLDERGSSRGSVYGQKIGADLTLIGDQDEVEFGIPSNTLRNNRYPRACLVGNSIAVSNVNTNTSITWINSSLNPTGVMEFDGLEPFPTARNSNLSTVYKQVFEGNTNIDAGNKLVLSGNPGLVVSDDMFSSSESIISYEFSPQGHGVIIWRGLVNGKTNTYAQRVSNTNDKVGDPIILSQIASGNYSIALAPDGGFAIFFSEYENFDTEYFTVHYDKDGVRRQKRSYAQLDGTAELSGTKGVEYNPTKNEYIFWVREGGINDKNINAWTTNLTGGNRSVKRPLLDSDGRLIHRWFLRENGEFIVTNYQSEGFRNLNAEWTVIDADLDIVEGPNRINVEAGSYDNGHRVMQGDNGIVWMMYQSALDDVGDEMLDEPYVFRSLSTNNILSDEQLIPADSRGTIRGFYKQNGKINLWEDDGSDLFLIEIDPDTFAYEHKMVFPEDHQNGVQSVNKHDVGLTFLLEELREPGRGEDIYSYLSLDQDQDGYFNFRDCNDTLDTVNPRAVDIPDNGIDENCDGVDSTSVLLPVEWAYIEGKELDNDALIEWGTSTEVNNDFFVIEKAIDGKSFKEIGQIDGSGNTNISQDYEFIDLSFSQSAYFRIKQVDYDGNYDYSETVFIRKTSNDQSILIYPNPVKSDQVLHIDMRSDSNLDIRVLDSTGKLMQSFRDVSGDQMSIQLTGFPKGIYFLQLTDNVTINEVRRLVVL